MGEEQVNSGEFAYSLEELVKPYVREENIEWYRELRREERFPFNEIGVISMTTILPTLEVLATLFTVDPFQDMEVGMMREMRKRDLLIDAALGRAAFLRGCILKRKISGVIIPRKIDEQKKDRPDNDQEELKELETFLQRIVEPATQQRSGSVEIER